MNEREGATPPAPQMEAAVPFVWTSNADASIEFYTEKLGFELAFRHDFEQEGAPYTFAVLEQGGVTLHLQHCCCPEERHLGQAFFRIDVDRPVELFELCRDRGLEFRFELRHEEWGESNFQVFDPDRNILFFGGPTPAA